MDPIRAGAKRQREYITVAEAREEVSKIMRLNEDDLCDARPDVNYVGRETLYELLDAWLVGHKRFLVFGPKGVGKSTDFRACFCILYKWAAAGTKWEDNEMVRGEWEGETQNSQEIVLLQGELEQGIENNDAELEHQDIKERMVFLWAEILLQEELTAVKSALRFSLLADKDQGLEAAIEKLGSLDEVVGFIQKRKEQYSENFHFFVDGGEKLDLLNFLEKPVYGAAHISAVVDRLKFLLLTGDRVWWCASAKARMTTPEQLPAHLCYENRGFSREEYAQYAANCILGKLETRYDSIVYLTGLVPLFLDVLCTCCDYAVAEGTGSRTELVRNSTLHLRKKLAAVRSFRSTAAGEELVEEDDYWDSVVRRFMEHPELKLVRQKASALRLTGECPTDADMARLDPTYVLNADRGLYCSGFIQRLYMQAVRSKEEQLKSYADGAWLAYAQRLLRSDCINWSSLGWLCEEVLASVIQKRGLVLGGLCIKALTLRDFDEIPSRRIRDLLGMKPNSGYYYKPRDVSFPFVDGVIVWVDEAGKLFIVCLQYTTNIDNHLESADMFMSVPNLMRWFIDIDEYLRPSSTVDSSNRGKVELHYAFLGCSSKPGYHRDVMKPRVRETKSRALSGVAGYRLHIQPFDEKSLPGLAPDDYRMLLDIAGKRTWKKTYCEEVCSEGLGLLGLQRKVLESRARKECGIQDPSPRKFKNKALLINAMVSAAKESGIEL